MSKLKGRRLKFANKYCECGNASQSAIYAGYSKNTARSQGQRLLTKEDIKEYIKKKQKDTSEKLNITKEYILKGLVDIHKLSIIPNEITGKFELTAGVSALDKLSRMLGFDKPDENREKTTFNFNFGTKPEDKSLIE